MTDIHDLALARPPMETKLTWKQWKRRWLRATDLVSRRGLLHASFNAETASAQEEAERVYLLLKLCDPNLLPDEREDWLMKQAWAQCAKDAFAVLYKNYIENIYDGERNLDDRFRFWHKNKPGYSPRVIIAFLQFFEDSKWSFVRDDLIRDYMRKKVKAFIRAAVFTVWGRFPEHRLRVLRFVLYDADLIEDFITEKVFDFSDVELAVIDLRVYDAQRGATTLQKALALGGMNVPSSSVPAARLLLFAKVARGDLDLALGSAMAAL